MFNGQLSLECPIGKRRRVVTNERTSLSHWGGRWHQHHLIHIRRSVFATREPPAHDVLQRAAGSFLSRDLPWCPLGHDPPLRLIKPALILTRKSRGMGNVTGVCDRARTPAPGHERQSPITAAHAGTENIDCSQIVRSTPIVFPHSYWSRDHEDDFALRHFLAYLHTCPRHVHNRQFSANQ
jgi:hypothetical protein